MTEINGVCSDRFDAVRTALGKYLESGDELGASIAVDIDGDVVVDLWGGFADEARTTPWAKDTIVNVWSSTKTLTSLAALVLVDRGELDLRAPVAAYWPEFAANGKQDIEVRHLLAAQAPWWEPGTVSGYHASPSSRPSPTSRTRRSASGAAGEVR